MRGDVPAAGIEWVKMGLAAACEIGSQRTKTIKPGRGKTNVRSITGPSWCDGKRSGVAQVKRGSIRVPRLIGV
jgi:hypothetical protein